MAMEEKTGPTPGQESHEKPGGIKEPDEMAAGGDGGVPPNEANHETGKKEPSNETGRPRGKRSSGPQFNAESIGQQFNNFWGQQPKEKALSELTMDLPPLRPNVDPFHHPKHAEFIATLEQDRILMLSSYMGSAAYAAAHTVVQAFRGTKKLTLNRTPNDADLNLGDLSEEDLLGGEPVILLIEIGQECTLLKTTVEAPPGLFGGVSDCLEKRRSYVVFSVKEDLIDAQGVRANNLQSYNVSHLCYLLSSKYGTQAEAREKRLRSALGLADSARSADLHIYYSIIKECLKQDRFDSYVEELEEQQRQRRAPHADQARRSAVFPRRSEVHRTAVFVGTYFPGLNHKDFDHLERLLLGDGATTKAMARQVFRPNGRLRTLHDKTTEAWADRWLRDADAIFSKCSLRTVAAENGAWVVDFREPQLRDEFRSDIEAHHSWYLRRQCDVLQTKNALFEAALSSTTVDDLVQLFVGRTVADPASFGPEWLERLAVMAYGRCKHPLAAREEMTRLVLLIREMLAQQHLHRVIGETCRGLLSGGAHETLLALLMALTPRLRAGSSFTPLGWMRRLLDEGADDARDWTTLGLLALARDSGAKIYDFLEVIRSWLPPVDRTVDSFSPANRVALEFPFYYTADTVQRLQAGQFQYPLFYALPPDPDKARETVGWLLEWILDERGAAMMAENPVEPLKSAADARIGVVGLVIEQWAWVLEGPSGEAPAEDRQLFAMVFEELNRRLSPRARASLQRAWQQRQEEQLALAATLTGDDRKNVITRKAKLEDLRWRLSTLPKTPEESLVGGLL